MKSILALFILASTTSVYAAASLDAHFAYRITGDRAAAPLQVFDNKGKTYLQLRDMNAVPAVFGEDGQPLGFATETPYIVLTDVYPSLILRYGRKNEARIQNMGYTKPVANTPGSIQSQESKPSFWYGSANPARETGQNAVPIPAKTPAQQKEIPAPRFAYTPSLSTVVDAPQITGQFTVNNGALEPEEKKLVESESSSVEFTIQGKKLYPAQMVRLDSLVKKIGINGVYRISHGRTLAGKRNGQTVHSRLTALGVSASKITLSSELHTQDDYVVIISGEKK